MVFVLQWKGGECYFGPFLQYHGQPLGEPVIPGRTAVLNPGLKIWPPAQAAFYIPKKKAVSEGGANTCLGVWPTDLVVFWNHTVSSGGGSSDCFCYV